MIHHRIVDASGDVSDATTLWHDFLCLINRLPGLSVLASVKHDFPGGGFSGLVLLAESHAAIHTWPEKRYAWLELATCGDPAALEAFVEGMSSLGLEVQL